MTTTSTPLRTPPVWRSLMFVPVTVDKFVETAHTRGADGLILDLEDSILPQDKAEARERVAAAAKRVGRNGADVLVRINRPWRLAVRDLEALVCREITAVMLAKAEDARHVRFIAEILDELEAERGLPNGHTRLMPALESPSALLRAEEIAAAHPRVVALTLGSEDFALSMGMAPTAEGLFYPKQQMAVAARAAGVMPMGFMGSVADIRAPDAFRAVVDQAHRLGFMGACVIHPTLVAVLNDGYRPQPEELAQARRVVQAFETSGAAGAIRLDGKMVDLPIVDRARQLIARDAAIEKRIGSRPAATA
ncbi:MAG TPA: CoA ester lyase [Burkholderiaceae bacterium]|jgi:citrate lyase subunit beta/citryl-CoA lyase